MLEDWVKERVKRLEDRFAIQDLVASYCNAIDGRDLARFVSLFTDDAVMRHRDGVTFHYPHAVTVTFLSNDEATGEVTGHAEMGVDGQLVLASIRYTDRYRRLDSAWSFAEREMAFGYY